MGIELVAGGARVVVLPEYGGRLHQVFVPVDGVPEPLLVAPEDVEQYRLRPTRGGSFPMAPWPNRVARGLFEWQGRQFQLPREGKPHANHGRALHAAWRVERTTTDDCELAVEFDDGWPWRGSVWQRFELEPGRLRMAMEVRATGEAFPAGCGWHPWFRRDVGGAKDLRLEAPASGVLVAKDQLPTGEIAPAEGELDLAAGPWLGERRIDHCYTGLSGPITLDWGSLRLSLTVECEESHVMVYTPEEAVCIEPQTCAPDAFNLHERGVERTGFAVAEPGRRVRIESTWRWDR
ncbi:MAG TPA: hypothetical protein VIH05_01925 [Tepidiformaceae bacterium]